MAKQIVVTVHPDGTTVVDAQGFHCQGCAAATKAIELAVAGGGGSVDDKKKPDFYGTHSNTGSTTR